MGDWDSLNGRLVKVYLRYPVVKKTGDMVSEIEGVCLVDGRKEIRLYSPKTRELLVVEKENITLITSDLTVEDIENLEEIG